MAAKYQSSKQTTNFARICRLMVDVIPDLFRYVLTTRLPASGLSLLLINQKGQIFSQLNPQQKKILYPHQGGVFQGSVKDLDLSLLYILLRNIGNIPPHQNGWGRVPDVADRSLSANIDRLRVQRNEAYAHAPIASLSDGDFQTRWAIIRQSVEDIQNGVLMAGSFVVAVDSILTMRIDPSTEKNFITLLAEIEGEISDVKDRQDVMATDMDNLEGNVSAVKADVDAVRDDVGAVKTDVSAVRDDVDAVKDDVGAVKDDIGAVMADVDAARADVDAARADVDAVRDDVDAVRDDVDAMRDDVVAVRDDVTAVRDDVGAVKTDVSVVRDDVGAVRDDVGAVRDDVGAVRDDVGAVRDDVTAVRDDVTAVRDDVGAVRDDVTAVRDDVTAVRDDVGAVRDDVTAVRDNVDAVRDDVGAVNERFNVISADRDIDPKLTAMLETTEAMILKEKESYEFITTKSLDDAHEKLLKNRIVIIKGNTGDGKTSIALELLRLLCNDEEEAQQKRWRRPLELHDIKDLDLVKPNSRLVIYLDDIFGKNVVSVRDVEEWEKRKISILAKLCGNDQSEANFLVITIRSGIFNSLNDSCLKEISTKQNIVDLNNYIDAAEKLKLLMLYEPKHQFVQWTDDEEIEIIKCAPDIGFPQCCRLFRDTPTLHTERVNFFKKPFDFMKDSLKKLKDGKFHALLYLFLNRGSVMEDDLDPYNENIDKKLLEAAFDVNVVKVTWKDEFKTNKRKLEFVKESLDCLLGGLVKKESIQKQIYGKYYPGYKFNHDSIEETVALLYGEKTPIGYIQNCPFKSLSYVSTSKTTPYRIVISSNGQTVAMYKRLVRQFESVYSVPNRHYWYCCAYHYITSLDVWTDTQFLQGFIRWLIDQNVDKNLCHEIKTALLNRACDSGAEEHALYLLSVGAKPDKVTPVRVVRRGWVNVLKNIVKYCNDEMKLKLLNTACSSAPSYCAEEQALYLLSVGAKPDVDTLFCVVRRGWVNVLKNIVKYLSDQMKLPLLDEACSSGAEECALFLLSEGVEPDKVTPFCVVEGGSVNVLHKLLEYDVIPTARARRTRSSQYAHNINVLHEACLCEREEMVTVLCDKYPHLVHDTDSQGHSTLHLVARTGNCGIFHTVERMVLKSLCRVEDEQHKCETVDGRVVHVSCVCAQYMSQLVDRSWCTVLHMSCMSNRSELSLYMCKSYPALTTVVDKYGYHCLHYIAEYTSDVDWFTECETHVKRYLESTGREYNITAILNNHGSSVLNMMANWRGTENNPLYDHLVPLFSKH